MRKRFLFKKICLFLAIAQLPTISVPSSDAAVSRESLLKGQFLAADWTRVAPDFRGELGEDAFLRDLDPDSEMDQSLLLFNKLIDESERILGRTTRPQRKSGQAYAETLQRLYVGQVTALLTDIKGQNFSVRNEKFDLQKVLNELDEFRTRVGFRPSENIGGGRAARPEDLLEKLIVLLTTIWSIEESDFDQIDETRRDIFDYFIKHHLGLLVLKGASEDPRSFNRFVSKANYLLRKVQGTQAIETIDDAISLLLLTIDLPNGEVSEEPLAVGAPYLDLVLKINQPDISPEIRSRFQSALSLMVSQHLRGDLFHAVWKDGEQFDWDQVEARHRVNSDVDHALMLEGIVGSFEKYERHRDRLVSRERDEAIQEILSVFSAAPRIFSSKEKLREYVIERVPSMYEDGALSPIGQHFESRLAQFHFFMMEYGREIFFDFARFDPARFHFSPLGATHFFSSTFLRDQTLRAIALPQDRKNSLEDTWYATNRREIYDWSRQWGTEFDSSNKDLRYNPEYAREVFFEAVLNFQETLDHYQTEENIRYNFLTRKLLNVMEENNLDDLKKSSEVFLSFRYNFSGQTMREIEVRKERVNALSEDELILQTERYLSGISDGIEVNLGEWLQGALSPEQPLGGGFLHRALGVILPAFSVENDTDSNRTNLVASFELLYMVFSSIQRLSRSEEFLSYRPFYDEAKEFFEVILDEENEEEFIQRLVGVPLSEELSPDEFRTTFSKFLDNLEKPDLAFDLGGREVRFGEILQRLADLRKQDGLTPAAKMITETNIIDISRENLPNMILGEESLSRKGLVTEVKRVLQYYLDEHLGLLSLRAWDEGIPLARKRQDHIQELLDQIDDWFADGNVRLLINAKHLPTVITSLPTITEQVQDPSDNADPYFDLAIKKGDTFNGKEAVEVSLGRVAMLSHHLRQVYFVTRYKEANWRVPDPVIWEHVRRGNDLDYLLLVDDLTNLLEAYHQLKEEGDFDDYIKSTLIQGILLGLAADPEMMTTPELFRRYTFDFLPDMKATSTGWTEKGRYFGRRYNRYVELLKKYGEELFDEFDEYGDEESFAYSPLRYFSGFALVELLNRNTEFPGNIDIVRFYLERSWFFIRNHEEFPGKPWETLRQEYKPPQFVENAEEAFETYGAERFRETKEFLAVFNAQTEPMQGFDGSLQRPEMILHSA